MDKRRSSVDSREDKDNKDKSSAVSSASSRRSWVDEIGNSDRDSSIGSEVSGYSDEGDAKRKDEKPAKPTNTKGAGEKKQKPWWYK